MKVLFVRLLDVPGQARGSRRARDGRTPFVQQQQAAVWFALPQPDVSRVEGYWSRGTWPALLSQWTEEILTPEVVRRVVTVCATCPHWSQEQVYRHLREQGLGVSQRQVRQAMEQSGWSTLRQELNRRYHWTPESFELREEWLVREILQKYAACRLAWNRVNRTPFSRDARPEIRGKSPLQLAGYDLSRIPMSCLCRGYSLEWHLTVESGDVPNS